MRKSSLIFTETPLKFSSISLIAEKNMATMVISLIHVIGDNWSRFLLYKYAIKIVQSCVFQMGPIVTRTFITHSQIQIYNFIKKTQYNRWTSLHKYMKTKSTTCMYIINSVMNMCIIINLLVGVSKSFKWVIFFVVHL